MDDVIVIGSGVVGAATAAALARQGQSVTLLEQFGLNHNRGSSHGDGRIIRFDYGEAMYVKLVKLAYERWTAIEQEVGYPLWQATGIWNAGPGDSPQLAELVTNFQHFGLPYEKLSAATSHDRFPQFQLEANSMVIYQPDGGVMFADKAVRTLAQVARQRGATLVTDARIIEIEPHPDHVTVISAADTRWSARAVVIAAGGWASQLLAPLGVHPPLTVTQEQVGYFAPKTSLDHSMAALPVLIDYHPDPPFYALPQIDIAGVKVGWHHTGTPVDPNQPQPVNAENMAVISEFVSRRYPHLDATPFHTVTCLYTNTPDLHFVMDRHPTYPNLVIGAGFSGHGFKFGAILGEILAAMALNAPPPFDVTPFSLARFESAEGLVKRTTA